MEPAEPEERTEAEGEEEAAESEDAGVSADRLWIIQCKREKNIGPTKIRSILDDFFKHGAARPYGYVLAAACNFSKKTLGGHLKTGH